MSLFNYMMKLPPVQKLALTYARKTADRFRSLDPLTCQRDQFKYLISTAASTRFGQDHGFKSMVGLPFEEAYALYQQRVPIRTYRDFWDDYFEGNQRIGRNGRKTLHLDNVTWPGRIKLFCESSGTTAPTKYIPFSRRMFDENRRAATDLISCYLAAHSDSRITSGKILYMSGSTALTEMERGVYSGDMSAITLRFRPWYLSPFVAPGEQVAALSWDEKLEAMAHMLLADDTIHVISGVPPWIILLLQRCMELSRRPLRHALPNLELIIHGGTSLAPYQDEFEMLFEGNLPLFIELLPSSEAFMAFQCAGDPGMRLTPFYGSFFEFVPFEYLDDSGKPQPKAPAVPLEQVVTGQRYTIILSTCAGLWRYHIGDTIRFTGISPHFIEFTGRDRFLDKLEEKVTQEEVEQVIAELNCSEGFGIREFIVGTNIPARRHVWVLAVKKESTFKKDEAIRCIDGKLRVLNADYNTFRSQHRIAAPEVLIEDEDIIYQWSQIVRGKLGGQSKIPHIDPTSDGSLIRSLKEFIGSRSTEL